MRAKADSCLLPDEMTAATPNTRAWIYAGAGADYGKGKNGKGKNGKGKEKNGNGTLKVKGVKNATSAVHR